ncbi:MAG: DNA mismatch repair protein MutS [Sedimentisphaerales bacterium]|nr:DNA mismatch repair protein MutS [Sedimentisphaerales bacterium]
MNNPTDNAKLTPAMRQYQHFKGQYPEAILFFRMGDFYETFYEDAKICSQVLGIALTSRNKGENPIPLAGIPYHAIDGYLHKMIKAGYKVAICEQMEDASQAKGVVKRDVVRLVTPGTLTEDALLDENVGNYLAAFCFAGNCKASLGSSPGLRAGLAWVDLSTGQFFAQPMDGRHLLDELVRLTPAECIYNEDSLETNELFKKFISQLKEITATTLTPRPGWQFDPFQTNETVKKHFGTASLEGFGFEHADCCIAAAGAVLHYLNETQKTALTHINTLRKVSRERFLQIDKTTLRSLEIERTIRDGTPAGSLLHSIDKTQTAMGARKLRLWVCYPLNDMEHIQRRQDSIAELVQLDQIRDKLRKLLTNIADIERITTRISTARATPRDLLGLGHTLRQMPEIKILLNECSTEMPGQLAQQCDCLEQLADLIESAINPQAGLSYRDGNVIQTGFDEEVDRLRGICQDGQSWLAKYQKKLIEQTGLNSLKVGFNKVFGYYVEVSRVYKGQVPVDFVRKQTVKNAERYITDELKRYETEALNAQQRCRELEEKLFQDIRSRIAAQTPRLQQVADAVAKIDVLTSLAHIARHRNYCRPQMHLDPELEIIEGRHPVLDVTMAGSPEQFVPNDVTLGGRTGDIAIITGPNMSGKSTYIRQTALLVLMAQMGSYIPAQSASIGLVDRIFTRVGASDELTRGQSTFMVEMIETANILNNATSRSLVILDEIGRGTSTYDGLALAWAITEHIAAKIKCRTLFATHYHEITELADLLNNVKNLNVAVREWKDEVVFLHKIIEGRTDKSYGIHVARLAGIPKNVITRSNEILEELESSFSREAHTPQLGGRIEAKPSGEQFLFDILPPDPLLEKLKETDLNNLTPLQAINLLNEIKKELENR